MIDERSVREVYPTFGPPHLLGPEVLLPECLDCWCKPRLVTLCQECKPGFEPEAWPNKPDCWRCGGEGIVDVAYDDGVAPVIIIHNSEEEFSDVSRP